MILLFPGNLFRAQASGWTGMPDILRLSDAVSPGQTFNVNGLVIIVTCI